jgi:WhiB family transcriptional regulator, redox-sensing transcriptional regulator
VLLQIYLAIGVVVVLLFVAVLAEGVGAPLGRPSGRGGFAGPRGGPGAIGRLDRPNAGLDATVGVPGVVDVRIDGRGSMEIEWMARAACREVDPEVFFPSDGAGVKVAKQVCARCDAAVECLEYALEQRLEHGVWGGASERERRRMRSARRRAGTAEPLARRTIEWWFPLTRR